MTREEFDTLTRGSVIERNSTYYVVFFPSEDSEFIDCQELSEIGKKIPDLNGYQHSNIDYRYANVVYDKTIISAIDLWINSYFECEPYSFIKGYICGNE